MAIDDPYPTRPEPKSARPAQRNRVGRKAEEPEPKHQLTECPGSREIRLWPHTGLTLASLGTSLATQGRGLGAPSLLGPVASYVPFLK